MKKKMTNHAFILIKLSANLIGDNATGIESRMHPFAMMLSANATASVYGISIPFSIRYSNTRGPSLPRPG